jgi:hypothetical protein
LILALVRPHDPSGVVRIPIAAFPQDIGVVFLQELAYEGRNVHPGPAIATSSSDLGTQMRMAMAFLMEADFHPESITYWDTNERRLSRVNK